MMPVYRHFLLPVCPNRGTRGKMHPVPRFGNSPVASGAPLAADVSDRKTSGRSGMYLGIDLGTSSVKVVLLDATDRLVAEADAPVPLSSPRPR